MASTDEPATRAELCARLVDGVGGGGSPEVEPDDPRSYYRTADRLVAEIPGAFQPNQYYNPANPEAHRRTTAPEILAQLDETPDAVVVPKIDSVDDVRAIEAALEQHGAPDRTKLWAMVETPVAMLKPGNGKTHRAYLWSYCTGAFEVTKVVVFDFADSRAGHHAQAFLGDAQRILIRHKGLGRPGKQAARKLIQNDNEGQTPEWRFKPVITKWTAEPNDVFPNFQFDL